MWDRIRKVWQFCKENWKEFVAVAVMIAVIVNAIYVGRQASYMWAQAEYMKQQASSMKQQADYMKQQADIIQKQFILAVSPRLGYTCQADTLKKLAYIELTHDGNSAAIISHFNVMGNSVQRGNAHEINSKVFKAVSHLFPNGVDRDKVFEFGCLIKDSSLATGKTCRIVDLDVNSMKPGIKEEEILKALMNIDIEVGWTDVFQKPYGPKRFPGP